MGDSLSIIFATIVASLLLFLFPMIDTWERQDDLSYISAYAAVINTVDAVRNTGRLTDDMYSDLVEKLTATGNRFNVQLEHRALMYVSDGTNMETVYVNSYNSDIIPKLEADGEYVDFRKGDYFYISVKNTNKTQATVLKQNVYGTKMETFKIGVPYGGQIKNEYFK